MNKTLFIIAFFLAIGVHSQNKKTKTKQFHISGNLISEDLKMPLESATIYVERLRDSSVINYTISDKNGKFILEDKTNDPFINLYITHIGYKTYFKKLDLSSPNFKLDSLVMPLSANQLDEVLITSNAPITIKKDTLEFNVKSFKTKVDATVEDLLKKLPGVEVDPDGKIRVNGKEVNKVLVNGKPFFGSDPTITTRNLAKEIIEKVQITDTKTKDEAFTGEEGDKKNKTLNLVIKEENNKGVFGNLSAGKGTNDRYEFAGMINFFDNDRRLSFLGGGNNANAPGFSLGGISGMYGSVMSVSNVGGEIFVNGMPYFGGGRGISSSRNAGVNYGDKISEKVDVSADYFYKTSSTKNENAVQRENILPDRRYFSNSASSSLNENNNHRTNLRFEIKLDSTLRIDLRPNFSYTTSNSESSTEEVSKDEGQVLTNESSNETYNKSTGKNFRNDFTITKKLKDGGFLKFNLSNSFDQNESDNYLDSKVSIYGDSPREIIRNQQIDNDRNSNSINTKVTYRIPIKAKEVFIDLSHNFNNRIQENTKSTYDFDDLLEDYTVFNEELSTDFNYKNKYNSSGLNMTIKKEKYSSNLGVNYINRVLENTDYLRPDLNLKSTFNSLELRSNFRYKLNDKSSVSLNYNLRNSPPQISQLQPYKNVTNPLNTIVGNPNLEPATNHQFYLNYYNSNYQKKNGFYAYLSASIRENQVVSKSTIDENLIRNTTYENVDGNKSLNANTSYHKTIKMDSVKSIRFNVSLGANINKSVNYNNGILYTSNNSSLTPSLGITFEWQDVLEIRPNYRLSFSKSAYDIDKFPDRNFSRHTLSIRTTTNVPKNLEWRNTINYRYNPNIADGFQKSSWDWNATLSYKILKEKGTLSLKVYDLLNQNNNARRIATGNYIQDSQSTVLSQYFMLGFKWKFNSMGVKKQSSGMRFNQMMIF